MKSLKALRSSMFATKAANLVPCDKSIRNELGEIEMENLA